jgi:hypothetical protein
MIVYHILQQCSHLIHKYFKIQDLASNITFCDLKKKFKRNKRFQNITNIPRDIGSKQIQLKSNPKIIINQINYVIL